MALRSSQRARGRLFRDRALQSKDAIDLLFSFSNKWRIVIIHILRDGTLRTNEMQAAITEISPKVLTQTLRGMERDGLKFLQQCRRVEYGLIPMGMTLIKPLADLCHWAQAHIRERDEARRRFEQKLKAQKNSPSRRALER